MATSIVAQRAEKAKALIQSDKFRSEVALALPAHVKPERFQRVLLTAVLNDDRLLQVDPNKVVKAALQIAPLGLFTDKLLGEAALVVDGKQEVQVRVMYRGLLKLMRQSGDVASAYAHEICEHDRVRVSLGTDKRLDHEPAETNRGQPTRYYAVVKYRTGEVDFEIMTVEEINAIRDRSDGWKAYKNQRIKDTPWASSYPEMAKKTVLRRLLKRVPASPDLAEALRIEEAADEKEYGAAARTPFAPAPAAAGPAIADEDTYVEVFDQWGEAFLRQPAEVEGWLLEQLDGIADLDALDAFLKANETHCSTAVLDAASKLATALQRAVEAPPAREEPAPAPQASVAPAGPGAPEPPLSAYEEDVGAPEPEPDLVDVLWPGTQSQVRLTLDAAKSALIRRLKTAPEAQTA